jgi:CTP:molybdopterin cytidylyltransferase MocA
MPKNRIGIIVLAAGASLRMGTPKQLLKIAGVSLIRRAAQNALDSKCSPVVIVLGANADLIHRELEGLKVTLAVNRDWETGMSTSIRCGVEKLLAIAPGIGGAILMLADQPGVTGLVLENLTETFAQNNSGLVAARYSDQLGTPALFPRAYFDELQLLDGKGGAKSLLKKYRGHVMPIDLPEAAFDLDTPEDLRCFSFKQATASQLSQPHRSVDNRGLQNGR